MPYSPARRHGDPPSYEATMKAPQYFCRDCREEIFISNVRYPGSQIHLGGKCHHTLRLESFNMYLPISKHVRLVVGFSTTTHTTLCAVDVVIIEPKIPMGPFITAYPAVQNYIHRPPNRDHSILDYVTNVNLNRKFHSLNGWTKEALSRAVKDVVGLRGENIVEVTGGTKWWSFTIIVGPGSTESRPRAWLLFPGLVRSFLASSQGDKE